MKENFQTRIRQKRQDAILREDLTVLRQAYVLKECGSLGTAVTHRVPSGLVVRPQINFESFSPSPF